MRYLGGKFRIGKAIADAIAPRGLWWEPFCGGLNVTRHLAAYGPGVVSDAHPALIALYQGVRAGWDPPKQVSRDAHRAARTLPDSDPFKGFAGFACSFAGDYFKGYAGDEDRVMHTTNGPKPITARPARAAALGLKKDLLQACASCVFGRADFLTEPVIGGFETLYCDPPYEGTTGYSTGAFDHTAFWVKCQDWARTGARVFVSEYRCPVPHEIVWSKQHRKRIESQDGKKLTTECLFRVLP